MIKKANEDIRKLIEEKKIYQWQVAKKLNMQDSNFSKILRTELNDDEKRKILFAIKEIEKEKLEY